jgi:hypothetical protein
MSKKTVRREKAAAEAAKNNKFNKIFGVVVGVAAALVVFSFSGTSRSATSGWIESTGTVVEAYAISELENEEEAGIYADIKFTDEAGKIRTERSNPLKTALSDSVGETVEIKYNPTGVGVLVKGNEKKFNLDFGQVIFIVAVIVVIIIISAVIKNNLPSPEDYAKRRNPQKSR